MTTLNGAKEWQRLFLVSPWISEMDRHGGMTLDQVVARLIKDQATAYVDVPPRRSGHAAAVEKFTAPREQMWFSFRNYTPNSLWPRHNTGLCAARISEPNPEVTRQPRVGHAGAWLWRWKATRPRPRR